MIRRVLIIIFISFCSTIFSQNSNILYGFDEIPQTLLLNPGAETNYKFHAGIPLLSGVSLSYGISGFTLADLFVSKGDFSSKFDRVFNLLVPEDNIKVNVHIDILNAGYRYDDKTYLSFGFYEELDLIGYFPQDIATLLYKGNSVYLNRNFSFSQLSYKADILGVLHAGISRKINKRLNVGARAKIYSSSFNLYSNNNSGTITTTLGQNNIYKHYFTNLDVDVKTSGLVDEDDQFIEDVSRLYKKSFLNGNLGIGFDFGFTYHVRPDIEVTASILDLGFINYSKNIKNSFLNGTHATEGINFEYNPSSLLGYWAEFDAELTRNLPRGSNKESYLLWRPAKINAAVKYSFGEIRSKKCFTETYKKYYYNAIGFQLNTVMRPLKPQFSFTSFIEKTLSDKILVKATHTVDEYSFTNIGFGLTTRIGKVNVYGVVDNVLKLVDLSDANIFSLQFGVNLIID
ncbi:hypothetical protein OD91_2273 [Lutibacter sp. Hel_I_33_5]|uniref:DUF5723 family protein n=1 Tax=Lutibacter sp. Hel_I_33_5 TaxID=1566289 RepID=UPI0011A6A9AB|nr:DUF5723 family protein [Lutibacter sp. Hel_I_33_5]TVZ56969.1 hypothetical protein OD91_2273 [Lutibacter sp. Hel_I_33_5]